MDVSYPVSLLFCTGSHTGLSFEIFNSLSECSGSFAVRYTFFVQKQMMQDRSMVSMDHELEVLYNLVQLLTAFEDC